MVPHQVVTATLRPLTSLDASAARVLADAVLGAAPYAEPFRAALDAALRCGSDEHRAIVAHDADVLVGLIVFGETAGAHGAGRIYFIAVDERARGRGVATTLLEAACRDLRERGARFVAIELPEDPHLVGGRAVAHRAGFYEEARVSDYMGPGVGLALLRRDWNARVDP